MQVSILAEFLCFGTVFDLIQFCFEGSVSEMYLWVVFWTMSSNMVQNDPI